MTNIHLSSLCLPVWGKALQSSNLEPCAWPCSAMTIPKLQKGGSGFVCSDFVLDFFLDVSSGCVPKAMTSGE